MKDLLVLAGVIGLPTAIGLVAVGVRSYKIEKKGWHLYKEEIGGDATEVWLIKGDRFGYKKHFCGRANRDYNYTDKLGEIEEAALDKMYEWNSVDRQSRRLYK